MERRAVVYHRNCNQLYVDSTYTVVQWVNADTAYLTPRFLESNCFTLFDSKSGRLIEESWEDKDTVYNKRYYSSGNLKSFSKSVHKKEPLYFHHIKKEYFESGQILYEGEYKSLSYSKHTTYYPNGEIESLAERFSYNPNPFGEYLEFFPNGQISKRTIYSLADTTTNRYQLGEVLSEEFFTESGEPTTSDQNELKVMYIPIYPPLQNEVNFDLGENTYAYEAFSDQVAYSNDIQEFKDRILQNLKNYDGLTCRKGVVWFWFFISEEGKIEGSQADFGDANLSAAVLESIQKIKEWPVGVLEGQAVKVYVFNYLLVDL